MYRRKTVSAAQPPPQSLDKSQFGMSIPPGQSPQQQQQQNLQQPQQQQQQQPFRLTPALSAHVIQQPNCPPPPRQLPNNHNHHISSTESTEFTTAPTSLSSDFSTASSCYSQQKSLFTSGPNCITSKATPTTVLPTIKSIHTPPQPTPSPFHTSKSSQDFLLDSHQLITPRPNRVTAINDSNNLLHLLSCFELSCKVIPFNHNMYSIPYDDDDTTTEESDNLTFKPSETPTTILKLDPNKRSRRDNITPKSYFNDDNDITTGIMESIRDDTNDNNNSGPTKNDDYLSFLDQFRALGDKYRPYSYDFIQNCYSTASYHNKPPQANPQYYHFTQNLGNNLLFFIFNHHSLFRSALHALLSSKSPIPFLSIHNTPQTNHTTGLLFLSNIDLVYHISALLGAPCPQLALKPPQIPLFQAYFRRYLPQLSFLSKDQQAAAYHCPHPKDPGAFVLPYRSITLLHAYEHLKSQRTPQLENKPITTEPTLSLLPPPLPIDCNIVLSGPGSGKSSTIAMRATYFLSTLYSYVPRVEYDVIKATNPHAQIITPSFTTTGLTPHDSNTILILTFSRAATASIRQKMFFSLVNQHLAELAAHGVYIEADHSAVMQWYTLYTQLKTLFGMRDLFAGTNFSTGNARPSAHLPIHALYKWTNYAEYWNIIMKHVSHAPSPHTVYIRNNSQAKGNPAFSKLSDIHTNYDNLALYHHIYYQYVLSTGYDVDELSTILDSVRKVKKSNLAKNSFESFDDTLGMFRTHLQSMGQPQNIGLSTFLKTLNNDPMERKSLKYNRDLIHVLETSYTKLIYYYKISTIHSLSHLIIRKHLETIDRIIYSYSTAYYNNAVPHAIRVAEIPQVTMLNDTRQGNENAIFNEDPMFGEGTPRKFQNYVKMPTYINDKDIYAIMIYVILFILQYKRLMFSNYCANVLEYVKKNPGRFFLSRSSLNGQELYNFTKIIETATQPFILDTPLDAFPRTERGKSTPNTALSQNNTQQLLSFSQFSIANANINASNTAQNHVFLAADNSTPEGCVRFSRIAEFQRYMQEIDAIVKKVDNAHISPENLPSATPDCVVNPYCNPSHFLYIPPILRYFQQSFEGPNTSQEGDSPPQGEKTSLAQARLCKIQQIPTTKPVLTFSTLELLESCISGLRYHDMIDRNVDSVLLAASTGATATGFADYANDNDENDQDSMLLYSVNAGDEVLSKNGVPNAAQYSFFDDSEDELGDFDVFDQEDDLMMHIKTNPELPDDQRDFSDNPWLCEGKKGPIVTPPRPPQALLNCSMFLNQCNSSVPVTFISQSSPSITPTYNLATSPWTFAEVVMESDKLLRFTEKVLVNRDAFISQTRESLFVISKLAHDEYSLIPRKSVLNVSPGVAKFNKENKLPAKQFYFRKYKECTFGPLADPAGIDIDDIIPNLLQYNTKKLNKKLRFTYNSKLSELLLNQAIQDTATFFYTTVRGINYFQRETIIKGYESEWHMVCRLAMSLSQCYEQMSSKNTYVTHFPWFNTVDLRYHAPLRLFYYNSDFYNFYHYSHMDCRLPLAQYTDTVNNKMRSPYSLLDIVFCLFNHFCFVNNYITHNDLLNLVVPIAQHANLLYPFLANHNKTLLLKYYVHECLKKKEAEYPTSDKHKSSQKSSSQKQTLSARFGTKQKSNPTSNAVTCTSIPFAVHVNYYQALYDFSQYSAVMRNYVQFKHIIIDESQDLNLPQINIINALSNHLHLSHNPNIYNNYRKLWSVYNGTTKFSGINNSPTLGKHVNVDQYLPNRNIHQHDHTLWSEQYDLFKISRVVSNSSRATENTTELLLSKFSYFPTNNAKDDALMDNNIDYNLSINQSYDNTCSIPSKQLKFIQKYIPFVPTISLILPSQSGSNHNDNAQSTSLTDTSYYFYPLWLYESLQHYYFNKKSFPITFYDDINTLFTLPCSHTQPTAIQMALPPATNSRIPREFSTTIPQTTLTIHYPQTLTLVGDDDQSIYGFRGAVGTVFISFLHCFPQIDINYLKINYRSEKAIVSACNNVIKDSILRIPKHIISSTDFRLVFDQCDDFIPSNTPNTPQRDDELNDTMALNTLILNRPALVTKIEQIWSLYYQNICPSTSQSPPVQQSIVPTPSNNVSPGTSFAFPNTDYSPFSDTEHTHSVSTYSTTFEQSQYIFSLFNNALSASILAQNVLKSPNFDNNTLYLFNNHTIKHKYITCTEYANSIVELDSIYNKLKEISMFYHLSGKKPKIAILTRTNHISQEIGNYLKGKIEFDRFKTDNWSAFVEQTSGKKDKENEKSIPYYPLNISTINSFKQVEKHKQNCFPPQVKLAKQVSVADLFNSSSHSEVLTESGPGKNAAQQLLAQVPNYLGTPRGLSNLLYLTTSSRISQTNFQTHHSVEDSNHNTPKKSTNDHFVLSTPRNSQFHMRKGTQQTLASNTQSLYYTPQKKIINPDSSIDQTLATNNTFKLVVTPLATTKYSPLHRKRHDNNKNDAISFTSACVATPQKNTRLLYSPRNMTSIGILNSSPFSTRKSHSHQNQPPSQIKSQKSQQSQKSLLIPKIQGKNTKSDGLVAIETDFSFFNLDDENDPYLAAPSGFSGGTTWFNEFDDTDAVYAPLDREQVLAHNTSLSKIYGSYYETVAFIHNPYIISLISQYIPSSFCLDDHIANNSDEITNNDNNKDNSPASTPSQIDENESWYLTSPMFLHLMLENDIASNDTKDGPASMLEDQSGQLELPQDKAEILVLPPSFSPFPHIDDVLTMIAATYNHKDTIRPSLIKLEHPLAQSIENVLMDRYQPSNHYHSNSVNAANSIAPTSNSPHILAYPVYLYQLMCWVSSWLPLTYKNNVTFNTHDYMSTATQNKLVEEIELVPTHEVIQYLCLIEKSFSPVYRMSNNLPIGLNTTNYPALEQCSGLLDASSDQQHEEKFLNYARFQKDNSDIFNPLLHLSTVLRILRQYYSLYTLKLNYCLNEHEYLNTPSDMPKNSTKFASTAQKSIEAVCKHLNELSSSVANDPYLSSQTLRDFNDLTNASGPKKPQRNNHPASSIGLYPLNINLSQFSFNNQVMVININKVFWFMKTLQNIRQTLVYFNADYIIPNVSDNKSSAHNTTQLNNIHNINLLDIFINSVENHPFQSQESISQTSQIPPRHNDFSRLMLYYVSHYLVQFFWNLLLSYYFPVYCQEFIEYYTLIGKYKSFMQQYAETPSQKRRVQEQFDHFETNIDFFTNSPHNPILLPSFMTVDSPQDFLNKVKQQSTASTHNSTKNKKQSVRNTPTNIPKKNSLPDVDDGCVDIIQQNLTKWRYFTVLNTDFSNLFLSINLRRSIPSPFIDHISNKQYDDNEFVSLNIDNIDNNENSQSFLSISPASSTNSSNNNYDILLTVLEHNDHIFTQLLLLEKVKSYPFTTFAFDAGDIHAVNNNLDITLNDAIHLITHIKYSIAQILTTYLFTMVTTSVQVLVDSLISLFSKNPPLLLMIKSTQQSPNALNVANNLNFLQLRFYLYNLFKLVLSPALLTPHLNLIQYTYQSNMVMNSGSRSIYHYDSITSPFIPSDQKTTNTQSENFNKIIQYTGLLQFFNENNIIHKLLQIKLASNSKLMSNNATHQNSTKFNNEMIVSVLANGQCLVITNNKNIYNIYSHDNPHHICYYYNNPHKLNQLLHIASYQQSDSSSLQTVDDTNSMFTNYVSDFDTSLTNDTTNENKMIMRSINIPQPPPRLTTASNSRHYTTALSSSKITQNSSVVKRKIETFEDCGDDINMGFLPTVDVLVTTIHQVKGLEFDCVFIPFALDQYYPIFHNCSDHPEQSRFNKFNNIIPTISTNFSPATSTTLSSPASSISENNDDLSEVVNDLNYTTLHNILFDKYRSNSHKQHEAYDNLNRFMIHSHSPKNSQILTNTTPHFPFSTCSECQGELRLFYVALSRAKTQIFLSYPLATTYLPDLLKDVHQRSQQLKSQGHSKKQQTNYDFTDGIFDMKDPLLETGGGPMSQKATPSRFLFRLKEWLLHNDNDIYKDYLTKFAECNAQKQQKNIYQSNIITADDSTIDDSTVEKKLSKSTLNRFPTYLSNDGQQPVQQSLPQPVQLAEQIVPNHQQFLQAIPQEPQPQQSTRSIQNTKSKTSLYRKK